ncbi:MAG: Glu/Leu/Phe/Val dehydrogenase family protein, partial [Pseudomonadota bacterium]
ENVGRVTNFVTGLQNSKSNVSGDPSPFTAHGVLKCIEVTARRLGKTNGLTGVSVAIQGLGNVGFNLMRELHAKGAKLLVADLDNEKVAHAKSAFGAEEFSIESLKQFEIDVFSPCALGGVVNEELARTIRARSIVGGANNQLATKNVGKILHDRRILYAPDFVCNAGGIIMLMHEYRNTGEDRETVLKEVDRIALRLEKIFVESANSSKASSDIAIQTAELKIATATERGSN